jgi:hypothetical protein
MQRSAQPQNRSVKHLSRISAAAAAFISAWLLAGAAAPKAASTIAAAPSEGAPRASALVRQAYGKLPLSFEANRGQADESVDFVARGPGYSLALAPTEAVFALRRGGAEKLTRKSGHASSETNPPATVLRMKLVGARRDATVAGVEELEGKVNYFTGSDPARWRTDIPTFARVRYTEILPGIDVVYYGNQRRLEYDFVVAPGKDPRVIALDFPGAESVKVEAATGDLLVKVGEETIRQHAPIAYQDTPAGRRAVESRYALGSGGLVGFEIGEYDAGAPLVIDPVLEYSTYLGGNSHDTGNAIAVDSAGSVYLTGSVSSTNFPTGDPIEGAHNDAGGSNDVFVTKMNPAGTALVYSTYLGGISGDAGDGIAVDVAGNAYVTGNAGLNFPTVNPIQAMLGGGRDAFVTKINAAGSALVYSTYLGGSESEFGVGIAVDSAGNAYIAGDTNSSNFPTVNPIQATFGGGGSGNFAPADAFVTKINAAGTALTYSTYLGGSDHDFGGGIALDSAGHVYITGTARSTNFPTANPIQGINGGSEDAFVTKINGAGTAFVYSTYLGGSGGDGGASIAVDSAGNAYLTGDTRSTNFPTATPIQGASGGRDAFVTKINAAGSALSYSTYLGGSGNDDQGRGIAVDSGGNAHVTGFTNSANFPTVSSLQSKSGTYDAFVTKFNAAGSALVYSTYLGGSGTDSGAAIAVNSAGDAYVTGEARSSNFPMVNAFQNMFGGISDAFICKISDRASSLLNIATRMRVLTGDSALIGGFIITGSDPKRVIIRGIGPSTNIPGALENPTLELFDSNQTLLGSNDDWKSNQEEVEATTIPPAHELESAIVMILAPGAYTAVLRGQNNGTGLGVLEVYDLNTAANSILANISSRGFVDTGDNAMIGGFIVGGEGAGARVLIRGVGPSLSSFFPNALENPTLELRNADGSLIRANDNWRDSQEGEIEDTTIPPSNNLESAIVASVGNGNYTAILRGAGNATGVGVVEVYNLR